MALKIDAAVYSHIGHRANNEDSFYFNGVYLSRESMDRGGRMKRVNTGDVQIYAVCDGMGGGDYGEEASFLTARALKRYQQRCPNPDDPAALNRLVDEASREIDAASAAHGLHSGDSGSTLAMLLLKDWYCRPVNIGDSRIYRLREGEMTRLTRDDSLVQDLVDLGQIAPEDAFDHPRKNVITRHVGMPPEGGEVWPTVGGRIDLREGDRFILCSDGLSDAMRDQKICALAQANAAPEDAAEQLVRTALADMENLGVASDNITVIVLDVRSFNPPGTDLRRLRRWRWARALSGLFALGALGGLVWSAMQVIRLWVR